MTAHSGRDRAAEAAARMEAAGPCAFKVAVFPKVEAVEEGVAEMFNAILRCEAIRKKAVAGGKLTVVFTLSTSACRGRK